MHNWSKSMMECVKSKIDAMGMDNLKPNQLEELKAWVCIAKDIAEYDYYFHITEAMEKPENTYGVNYDENGKYYTPMRNSRGQYMRRGYDEMYDMSPMYRDNERMYYEGASGMSGNGINSSNMNRAYSDSRYERARRGYEESKMMDPNNENMDKLKEVFEELKADMKELKPHMSQTGKNYAHNELMNMANTMV